MMLNFVRISSSRAIRKTKTVDLNSERNGFVQHLYYAFFSIEEELQLAEFNF